VPAAQVPELPVRRFPIAVPSATVADDPRAARLGQAVHRLLEWMGRPDAPLPRADWPAAAGAAARAFGIAGVADEVLAVAAAVYDSPDCGRFFGGPALAWAGNELPIADGGETLRLDRLVRLEADGRRCWWVLDYKLGEQPDRWPAYRQQLGRYLDAVRAAHPGEHVEAAFITGSGRLVPLAEDAGAM
jgi:ATP-dependent helicase/nuclease subunit A